MEYAIVINSLNDCWEIYDLISSKEYEIGAHITIDLREHKFFEPVSIVVLTMCIINLMHTGCSVFLILPQEEKFANYLHNIGFLEFCKTNYEKTHTLSSIQSQTAMPIRRLDPEYMDEYTMQLLRHFGAKCVGKDTAMLNLSIAELINNVSDHAESPISAYIFSQYFPATNDIKIIVGDYGIGIPNRVNNFFVKNSLDKKSNSDCLRWALELNKSSLSKPHNKGKGLNNIHDFIQSSNSAMRIFSDDVLLIANRNGDRYYSNPIKHFQGTVVEVTINIDGLSEDENIIVDNLW